MNLEQSLDLKMLKAGRFVLDSVLYAGAFGTAFVPLVAGVVARDPVMLCLYGLAPVELLVLNRIAADRGVIQRQITILETQTRKK